LYFYSSFVLLAILLQTKTTNIKPAITYLFTSARLGFRNWILADIDKLHEINSDEKVMEFFPAMPTKEQTTAFVVRMQEQFATQGFCYFAVDKLETGALIGFIGFSLQTFEAAFTPCIDIGWRISSRDWNQGYATEGANRCLEYAFDVLKIDHVFAIAPKINVKSAHIMTKIGMQKQYEFEHPLLLNVEQLKTCVLYKINRIWRSSRQ
jgi:RimJ/RimL family protein N-acetyltransferase